MAATIEELVDGTLEYVGEIAGASTEQYAEDKIKAEVIRGFNLLFKKYHWPQFSRWFEMELDGTAGLVDADTMEQVLDFEDFRAVYVAGQTTPLPVLSDLQNPFTLTGTRARFWTSLPSTHAEFETKRLQFWPKTAESELQILAREYPINLNEMQWDWGDRLHLDRDMLISSAAFMTLVGDDLNANAAKVAQGMMEMRFTDIVKSLSAHPIAMGGSGGVPSEWRTYP
jgi:hypothetical protein